MEKKDNRENGERRVAGIILSSQAETDIVRSLTIRGKRFSELQKELGMTSGRLNYHLIRLRAVGILTQRDKHYVLSAKGEKIAKKYL
jgi:predicted transcriptional regulator